MFVWHGHRLCRDLAVVLIASVAIWISDTFTIFYLKLGTGDQRDLKYRSIPFHSSLQPPLHHHHPPTRTSEILDIFYEANVDEKQATYFEDNEMHCVGTFCDLADTKAEVAEKIGRSSGIDVTDAMTVQPIRTAWRSRFESASTFVGTSSVRGVRSASRIERRDQNAIGREVEIIFPIPKPSHVAAVCRVRWQRYMRSALAASRREVPHREEPRPLVATYPRSSSASQLHQHRRTNTHTKTTTKAAGKLQNWSTWPRCQNNQKRTWGNHNDNRNGKDGKYGKREQAHSNQLPANVETQFVQRP